MLTCAIAAAALTLSGPMPDKRPGLLAYGVSAQARDLAADLADNRAEPGFDARVEQFAASSMQLSQLLRDLGAPKDLACIFKGISEDAAVKADSFAAADTLAERAFVARELKALFADAVELAPQAASLKAAPGY